MRPIIKSEGISKQYRIGKQAAAYSTVRESIMNAVRSPLKRLRQRSVGDRTIWALKDINFDVYPGEVVGLIGRNGAGKSTLLKILSRITEPTAGSVKLYGRVGSLLEVGTGFHPELSGRENIFLNGAILGMRRGEIESKFDEIVSFAEVEKFIDTPVKRYSSGMYLRLAFAVAAHLEPEILLVDEVLAVGDAVFQKKCLTKMGNIAEEGRTVLFVSHNMPAIKTLCSRVILIDRGVIEREGQTSSVIQYYMTGEFQDSKKIWKDEERPGNHSFKLHAMRLLDANGAEASTVNISDELTVEVSYEVIKEGAAVGFSLILFDSEGYCLFGSVNNKEQEFYGKPLPCGEYKSTCRLPGNMLNAGIFNFSIVGFSANWTDPFKVDQAVSFEAVDDGLLRGDYYGTYGGPLRPKLEWETVQSSWSLIES